MKTLFGIVCIILVIAAVFYGVQWFAGLFRGVSAPAEAPTIAEIEKSLGTLIFSLPRTLPSILRAEVNPSPPPTPADGGWIVVNQADWNLAEETRFIDGEKLPKQASEVVYIVVVSPVEKVSAGWYKYQGSVGGGWEEFRSRYTVYLVDWRSKQLISSGFCTSSNHGSAFPESNWKEDQTRGRPSILDWLQARGVIEPE